MIKKKLIGKVCLILIYKLPKMSWYWYLVFWIIVILVVAKIYIKFTTGLCRSNVCLMGKTVIVTGANGGIGYESAAEFAKRGARVILACRDPQKGKNARDRLINETDNPNIVFRHLDLASFKSVRLFCEEIKSSEERLDILVNNAGVSMIGSDRTEDGLLVLIQTNYFGPFLLTNLLLDLLKNTPKSRIVNISSIAAQVTFKVYVEDLNYIPKNGFKFRLISWLTHFMLYSRSKVCLIFFTQELAKRLKGTGVTAYSVHPGTIQTDIFRGFSWYIKAFWFPLLYLCGKDQIEGIQTTIYCSIAKGIEQYSGKHFSECQVVTYLNTRNPTMPGKLWEATEKIVGLK